MNVLGTSEENVLTEESLVADDFPVPAILEFDSTVDSTGETDR